NDVGVTTGGEWRGSGVGEMMLVLTWWRGWRQAIVGVVVVMTAAAAAIVVWQCRDGYGGGVRATRKGGGGDRRGDRRTPSPYEIRTVFSSRTITAWFSANESIMF
nr:hypothetical protein [Tanacetum cinerariifolium]